MAIREEDLKAVHEIIVDNKTLPAELIKNNQGKLTIKSGNDYFLLFTDPGNTQKYLDLLTRASDEGLYVAPFFKGLKSVQFGQKTYAAVLTRGVQGASFKGVDKLDPLINRETDQGRRSNIFRFLRIAANLKLQDIQGFITADDGKPICFIDINCNASMQTPSPDIVGLLNKFGQ